MQGFKTYLEGCLGSVYVWGGQGEVIPGEAWIRAKEKKQGESAVRRAVTFYQRRVAALRALGREDEAKKLRAFDCSGLIVRYMFDAGLADADMTAAGLYSKCVKFAARELGAGDLVFRHNGERITHVGVYMGDGSVIEARGRDYGVVRTAFWPEGAEGDSAGSGAGEGDAVASGEINVRGWTHFGSIAALSNCWEKDDPAGADIIRPREDVPDGSATGDAVVPDGSATGGTGADTVAPSPVLPCFAFVSGGSVNVRAEASTGGRVVAVAHRGDLLIAGRTENGFAQAAAYICKIAEDKALSDGAPVAGYISEKYIKRLNG